MAASSFVRPVRAWPALEAEAVESGELRLSKEAHLVRFRVLRVVGIVYDLGRGHEVDQLQRQREVCCRMSLFARLACGRARIATSGVLSK